MASLYEISATYSDLLAQYECCEDDETRERLLNDLASVGDSLTEKAEAYARIIRNKDAEAKALKAEADRLTEKRKAAEAAVTRLKAAMLDAMQLAQVDEMPTSIGKWRTQYNPVSCEIINPECIPARYLIPQPDKIDKKKLIDDYKRTGEVFNGVEFKQELGVRFR